MNPPRPETAISIAHEARAIALGAEQRSIDARDAYRSVYEAQGEIARELATLRRISADQGETLKRIERRMDERPRQQSIHDFVEATTGIHGTDSTPPAIALLQRGWWKVLETGLKVGFGAGLMWIIKSLWELAHR